MAFFETISSFILCIELWAHCPKEFVPTIHHPDNETPSHELNPSMSMVSVEFQSNAAVLVVVGSEKIQRPALKTQEIFIKYT
jgi:hypothetical protein